MTDPSLRSLGGSMLPTGGRGAQQNVHVRRQSEFAKLLAFAGRSIDDVVNSPIAKADLRCWYKTSRQVARLGEIHDLEKQWNPMQ